MILQVTDIMTACHYLFEKDDSLVEVMADSEAIVSICFLCWVDGEPALQVPVSITPVESNLSLIASCLIVHNQLFIIFIPCCF